MELTESEHEEWNGEMWRVRYVMVGSLTKLKISSMEQSSY